VAAGSAEEPASESGSAEESKPTKPTAAKGGGTPPQSPRLSMAVGESRRGAGWLWGLLIAVVVLLATAAAVWFFLSREGKEVAPLSSPSPTPMAWTGAWGRLDGVGGGLVVAGNDEAYEVTLYDAVLRPGESVPAILDAEERELLFALPSQFSFGGGPVGPFGAALTLGDDPDRATLVITDTEGTSALISLHRVPELTPTSPSVSPSGGASPSGVDSAVP
jgi:hypothetical protein